MSKPLKLSAVLAVRKGIKSRSLSVVTALSKIVQKPELFEGFARVYRKRDDADMDLPSERKVVQYRVKDALSALRMSKIELIDTSAQVDEGNTRAKASVWVDGKEVLPEIPVETLLSLEKELVDIRTFVEAIPVLDHAEAWKPEADGNSGLWVTEVTSTLKTKKVQKSLVLLEPTKEHPGQAQLITEDQIVGFWETQKQSGALRRSDKESILARTDKLLNAVKQAREQANDTVVSPNFGIGAKLFDFLLGPQ
jgi:hypothetical protein